MKNSLIVLAMLLTSSNALSQTEPVAASHAYDGIWLVTLDCADTQDRRGMVKGYVYTFRVAIVDGKLNGQYGEQSAPASVVYSGEVSGDGTLEVRAVGNTGDASYSVGTVARGTRYGYTLVGKLGLSGGEAVRRETRPCKATFSRL